jgi:hypothetical protein
MCCFSTTVVRVEIERERLNHNRPEPLSPEDFSTLVAETANSHQQRRFEMPAGSLHIRSPISVKQATGLPGRAHHRQQPAIKANPAGISPG